MTLNVTDDILHQLDQLNDKAEAGLRNIAVSPALHRQFRPPSRPWRKPHR